MNFLKNNGVPSLAFFTFHKCGSQWVRDVINSKEVSEHTGLKFDNREINLNIHSWPIQKSRTLLGPIYNCGYDDWIRNKRKGQKALVVLRDPRDRMISWIYSVLYSHVNEPYSQYIRNKFNQYDDKEKIKLANVAAVTEFSGIAAKYRSWFGVKEDKNLYVTTYEKLLNDSVGEFSQILDKLSFSVPIESLKKAVDLLSFEARSGRQRGDENNNSHYRSGIVGGWKTKFSEEDCDIWKAVFQNILTAGGWESDENWGISSSDINR
jgi:hypothetical protein